MKKYFVTLGVLALFAIGFAASDESSENKPTAAAQDSLTETANSGQDTVEPASDSSLTGKKKEIHDAGFGRGFLFAQSPNAPKLSDTMEGAEMIDEELGNKANELFDEMAAGEYDTAYGVPTTAEDAELKEIYIKAFRKGFEAGGKINN